MGELTEHQARVVRSAEHTWSDRDDAHKWLTTPHPEVAERTPLESAITELGACRVQRLLDSIFYGLPL